MQTQYVDHVGNPLATGDHVVIKSTGQVARVVAIDGYRSVPVQVQIGRLGLGPRGVRELRWCAPERLLRVPDPPLGPRPLIGCDHPDFEFVGPEHQ